MPEMTDDSPVSGCFLLHFKCGIRQDQRLTPDLFRFLPRDKARPLARACAENPLRAIERRGRAGGLAVKGRSSFRHCDRRYDHIAIAGAWDSVRAPLGGPL